MEIKEKEELKKKISQLEQAYTDLENMHTTVAEHSSSVEEELFEKNAKIEKYISSMKKYLSPQLFKVITSSTDNEENIGNSLDLKRQRVTCFFSDIVSFSDMTDSCDPETLSDCLNYYLKIMSDIVLEFDGTLDKFIGDAMMVFFGAPNFESDEIHAIKCVKMAMKMQSEIHQVNQYWSKKGISREVKIRIGINTGYVTVGNFGTDNRIDYTIIGNAVNLASRLESHCAAGGILISEATKSLIEDQIQTISKGTFRVKGIHTPVKVFEPLMERQPTDDQNLFQTDRLLKIQDNLIILNKSSFYYDREMDLTKKRQLIENLRTMFQNSLRKIETALID